MAKVPLRGVTLLELLIVVSVLLIAILGLWGTFITGLNSIIQAQEISIAADDLKDVFEKLKNVPFPQVSRVFDQVAENVENGQDSVAATAIGGFALSGESITITYPQLTAPTPVANLPDPLEISVMITWNSKVGRVQSKTMKTIRTGML